MKDQNRPVYKIKPGQSAFCPPKDQTTWSEHPRVYIDLDPKFGKTRNICPYCGNQFELDTTSNNHGE